MVRTDNMEDRKVWYITLLDELMSYSKDSCTYVKTYKQEVVYQHLKTWMCAEIKSLCVHFVGATAKIPPRGSAKPSVQKS